MRRTRAPILVAALAAGFAAGKHAHAGVSVDTAAALLVYPLVQVGKDGGLDTVIELSNESDAAISVRCFYAGGPGLCPDQAPCASPAECSGASPSCIPVAANTHFELRITPRQPLWWRASQGRATFPCSGAGDACPGDDSNEGSSVPSLSSPYVGGLYCTVVDPATRRPRHDNVLQGSATIEELDLEAEYLDAARYSAVGVRAFEEAFDGNSALTMDGSELEACPSRLAFHHLAELYIDTVGEDTQTTMLLAVVPCTWDGAHALPPRATLQVSVYNEFEQRFLTSLGFVRGPQLRRLSSIDSPSQPSQSIFAASVAATASLHTDLAPVTAQSGVLAIMLEVRTPLAPPSRPRREALQGHHAGLRTFDVVFFDPPECPGDCIGDHRFDAADVGRLAGRFNSGCSCAPAAGVPDALCGPGDFPFNQCYAADLDGNRCVAPSELTRILGDAPVFGPDGCPPL